MVQLANLNKKQRLARLDPRFTSKLFFSLFSMVQLANLNNNRHREAAFSTWRLSLLSMMQLASLNNNRHREAAFSPRVVWIRVLPLNCFSLFSMQQLAEREGGVFFKWGVALVKPRHPPFSHAVYFWGVGGILGKKCDTCDTIKKTRKHGKLRLSLY